MKDMSAIITSKNKGVIYYFSGTGNTLFVSKQYEKLFAEKKILVDIVDIFDIDVVSSQSKYDFIIIAFPVYAWMPPKLVTDFVKKLPTVSKKPAHVLATCRHSSGGSLRNLEKILITKGFDVGCSFDYILPQNIFAKAKDLQDTEERISKTKLKIKEDFQKICSGEKDLKQTSFFINFISKVVSSFFNRFVISKKGNWVVDYSKCTFCGVCERVCPTKNIVVKKKKRVVHYSDKCVFCTRCYNLCPVNAIKYKKQKDKDFAQYNHFKDYYLK